MSYNTIENVYMEIVNTIDKVQHKCHLCLSCSTYVVFEVHRCSQLYTVINCQNCDLLQTVQQYDPISPDYIAIPDEAVDSARIWCQSEHKLPAFRLWFNELNRLSIKPCSSLSLLDVGCGTGGFVRFAARHGINAYGFDASEAQVKFARHNLRTVHKAFSTSEFLQCLGAPGLRFDIVTMWDVLEHIRTPLVFLASVWDVLKPGGMLFVSVPNGRAMLWKRQMYTLFRKKHDLDWLPWEHVFYYSMRSLMACLGCSGFQLMGSGAVPCYPRPVSPFELARRLGFLASKVFPNRAPQIYAWARRLN